MPGPGIPSPDSMPTPQPDNTARKQHPKLEKAGRFFQDRGNWLKDRGRTIGAWGTAAKENILNPIGERIDQRIENRAAGEAADKLRKDNRAAPDISDPNSSKYAKNAEKAQKMRSERLENVRAMGVDVIQIPENGQPLELDGETQRIVDNITIGYGKYIALQADARATGFWNLESDFRHANMGADLRELQPTVVVRKSGESFIVSVVNGAGLRVDESTGAIDFSFDEDGQAAGEIAAFRYNKAVEGGSRQKSRHASLESLTVDSGQTVPTDRGNDSYLSESVKRSLQESSLTVGAVQTKDSRGATLPTAIYINDSSPDFSYTDEHGYTRTKTQEQLDAEAFSGGRPDGPRVYASSDVRGLVRLDRGIIRFAGVENANQIGSIRPADAETVIAAEPVLGTEMRPRVMQRQVTQEAHDVFTQGLTAAQQEALRRSWGEQMNRYDPANNRVRLEFDIVDNAEFTENGQEDPSLRQVQEAAQRLRLVEETIRDGRQPADADLQDPAVRAFVLDHRTGGILDANTRVEGVRQQVAAEMTANPRQSEIAVATRLFEEAYADVLNDQNPEVAQEKRSQLSDLVDTLYQTDHARTTELARAVGEIKLDRALGPQLQRFSERLTMEPDANVQDVLRTAVLLRVVMEAQPHPEQTTEQLLADLRSQTGVDAMPENSLLRREIELMLDGRQGSIQTSDTAYRAEASSAYGNFVGLTAEEEAVTYQRLRELARGDQQKLAILDQNRNVYRMLHPEGIALGTPITDEQLQQRTLGQAAEIRRAAEAVSAMLPQQPQVPGYQPYPYYGYPPQYPAPFTQPQEAPVPVGYRAITLANGIRTNVTDEEFARITGLNNSVAANE